MRTAAAATAAVGALVAAGPPPPGPVGIGDRLFPHLGNPGLNVTAYDIAMHYSGDNTAPVHTVTTIDARVTADGLSRFNLDFAGGTVHSVRVGQRPAAFRRTGEDLLIKPAVRRPRGAGLRITVRHANRTGGHSRGGGWLRTRDGLVAVAQPDAAHRMFPGNDHPSDKARFTFRITAPNHLTAVANGRRTSRAGNGGETTWTYRARHPMATELVQIAIGRLAVVHDRMPGGPPLRHVMPAGHRAALAPWLARTPRQLHWLQRRLGRYPFACYGVLAAEADVGFALETQTLSLFPRSFFTDPGTPDWHKEAVMVHELAHQWFGNSVTPHRWSDLWLSEGHATWYQWRYAAERGGPAFEERVRDAYRGFDVMRALGGPPAAPRPPRGGDRTGIFRPVVYDGAAVVLYALRQEIGAAAYQRLQRAWVTLGRDGAASTADFVRLAGRISGRDLRAFLWPWLYGQRTPPMPGRPHWEVTEAGPAAASPPPSLGAAQRYPHPHRRTGTGAAQSR